VSCPTDRLGKSSKERLDLSHIGRLSVIINRAVDCRTLGLVTKLCPMHRVVAIALAGNRIEITEMVVNPLADDPDRHTCGKNCVVFRSPNLLPRVRILRGIVVTDNRGDASLLQRATIYDNYMITRFSRMFGPIARGGVGGWPAQGIGQCFECCWMGGSFLTFNFLIRRLSLPAIVFFLTLASTVAAVHAAENPRKM